jgi:hypothetical protein
LFKAGVAIAPAVKVAELVLEKQKLPPAELHE